MLYARTQLASIPHSSTSDPSLQGPCAVAASLTARSEGFAQRGICYTALPVTKASTSLPTVDIGRFRRGLAARKVIEIFAHSCRVSPLRLACAHERL